MANPITAAAPVASLSTFSDNLGFLRVKVCSGKTIGNKPNFENVYITVSLADTAETAIKRSAQKTKRNHRSTEWNESFDLILDPAATLLRIKATHAGTIRNESLGTAFLPVKDLMHEIETDTTVTLFDKNRKLATGTVFIKHQFFGARGNEGNRPAVLYTASKKEVARSERRTQSLSRVFNIPATERVIQKYECALDGKPPVKGILCLTQHYLFFYTKGNKMSLRLADVEVIEQKSTPTGGSIVRILTNQSKEYIFGNVRKVERVVDQIKRTRQLALVDRDATPEVDVSALNGEPDDAPSDSDAVLTEADSSEPETTDDERLAERSPLRAQTIVHTESAPITPVRSEAYSAPGSVERAALHPAAPVGIMSAEISAVLHDIDTRRHTETTATRTSVAMPVVTGTSTVPAVIRNSVRSDTHFPTDDEREMNLSPNPASPRYQTPAITSKEVVPDTSRSTAVAAPVVPVLAQVATTSNILASAPTRTVHSAITASGPVVDKKHSHSFLYSITSTEQQILLIPLLSFFSLFTFFIFSSWSRLYNGVVAATIMGSLAGILQPANLAILAFQLITDSLGRKDLNNDTLMSNLLQAALTGVVCLPLQLVSVGLVGGVSLGIFSGILSCLLIGGACMCSELYLHVGEKRKEN